MNDCKVSQQNIVDTKRTNKQNRTKPKGKTKLQMDIYLATNRSLINQHEIYQSFITTFLLLFKTKKSNHTEQHSQTTRHHSSVRLLAASSQTASLLRSSSPYSA